MAAATSRSSSHRSTKKSAGNSPTPDAYTSTCGHANCTGYTCQVRYVGPTSSLRDHHIIHAARGAHNVWVAATVAGLAVVITGAVAFSGVGAAERNPSSNNLAVEMHRLEARIGNLQDELKLLSEQCSAAKPAAASTCQTSCKTALNDCLKVAKDDGKAKLACQVQGNDCASTCRETSTSSQ